MRRFFLLASLLAVGVSPAAASDLCPQGEDWSAACLETAGKERRVKPQYLDRLAFNRQGMAVLVIDAPREVLAVNRRGAVVVPGIAHAGDFDFPDAEQGIGRFYAQGKCGYFRAGSFQVVVPAAYDACEAFRDGAARACRHCIRYCTAPECQDSQLAGGEGFVFNARGVLLRRFTPAPKPRK